MISWHIIHSDHPDFLGEFDFHWNKIILGGPFGLMLSRMNHPPIEVSIYKEKYLLFSGEHFSAPFWVNDKKTSLPFVATLNHKVRCQFFELQVTAISLTDAKTIEEVYKEKNKLITRESIEAQILQSIFKD